MARATRSLPVPVSPVSRTVASVLATISAWSSTRFRAELFPTMSSKCCTPRISLSKVFFLLRQAVLGLCDFAVFAGVMNRRCNLGGHLLQIFAILLAESVLADCAQVERSHL